MGVTSAFRPLTGFLFAALLALSLIATTTDALAGTSTHRGGSALFDRVFVDRGGALVKPGPIGRLGVTWE